MYFGEFDYRTNHLKESDVGLLLTGLEAKCFDNESNYIHEFTSETDHDEISTPPIANFTESTYQITPPTEYISRISSADNFDYYPYYTCNTSDQIRDDFSPPISSQVQQPTVKCRQLPCKTFISTGSCPYGDRCVFLHDMSIVSTPIYIKSKVNNITYE